MLKSEITPRTEYGLREKRMPGAPFQRIRIIEHISGNKWKAEWIDPNPGLAFATAHLQAGVDLRTVQQWMGHKDLASTMRYLKYARGKGVLEKVNQTFSRPGPQLVRTGS